MGKGLAILGVPVMGGGPKTLVVTTFTQSLGAELLTNGDFSAWTGNNPNGWAVTETAPDPEVTERGTGQGHAGAGNGSANLYSSATNSQPSITQNVMGVGNWHEIAAEVSVHGAGGSKLRVGGLGGSQPTINIATLTNLRTLGRASFVTFQIVTFTPPADITVDSASCKRITLNAQQIMPSADAIIDFTYALPVSPAAGDTISVFYRISDASLEAGYNCWRAYLQRNATNTAWDFLLDSVNANTATNRINVTGVGDTVGIRVQCNGTLHDCWTTANGVDWTKRGAAVDVSHNNTATGVNTIYTSAATPTQLTVTP